MKKYRYTITIALSLAVSLLAFTNTPKNAARLYEAATKEFDANHFESSLRLYLKSDSAYRTEGLTNTAEYAQA